MSGGALHRVRVWSLAEIERDSADARGDFRQRRLGEPLARYLDAFDVAQPAVAVWVSQLERLLAEDPQAEAAVTKLLTDETGRTAFRYLGAPPISEDDLETLSEARLARFAAARRHGSVCFQP